MGRIMSKELFKYSTDWNHQNPLHFAKCNREDNGTASRVSEIGLRKIGTTYCPATDNNNNTEFSISGIQFVLNVTG